MATIEDVAKAAGVSIASVSRVITGSQKVRGETRAAVLKAAEELGYQANFFASSLRGKPTKTIGIVVPEIRNPFFIELIAGIERLAQFAGYDSFLCDSQNDPLIEANRIRALMARKVEGVVVVCCDEHESLRTMEVLAGLIPVVAVDRPVQGMRIDQIGVNNFEGMRAIISHLQEIGRRRFAFVGAESTVSAARVRSEAYLAHVGRNDLGCVLTGTFSVEWGEEAAARLLQQDPRPDAIVCANDLIAVGVTRGLMEGKAKLPEEIAVTGFDDIALCRLVQPGITTVRQPVDEIASEATERLFARIAGRTGAAANVQITPELVVRGSTVPANALSGNGLQRPSVRVKSQKGEQGSSRGQTRVRSG